MSYVLVLAAMAAGMIPHFPGFSPIFGGLLFAGARLPRRDRLWFPLLLVAAVYAAQSVALYHLPLTWDWPATVVCMFPLVAAGGWLATFCLDAPDGRWRAGFDGRQRGSALLGTPPSCLGLLSQRSRPLRLAAASTLGATGFFLASNFAIWWMGSWYPHSLAGLGLCYVAGLPFYGNSILAGGLFGGFLFSAEAFLRHRKAALAESR